MSEEKTTILSENLNFLKSKKRVEAKEIALNVNKSSPMVSKYLSADSYPPIPTLIKLAKYFEVSIDDLLLIDLANNNPSEKYYTQEELDKRFLKIENLIIEKTNN